MQRSGVVAACVGLALAAAIAFRSAGSPATGPIQTANLDFTLKDMNGREVHLANFKGKPLIVNFWATYCVPCQLETPELVDLAAKYKNRGLAIVGISIGDSPDLIRQFASEYKVTYPLLIGLDRDDVDQAFGLGQGIPMSVFVKSDGTIHGRLEGIATTSWLEKQVQALF